MFEKWKTRYEKDWATEGQLQRLVVLDVLTEQEYQAPLQEKLILRSRLIIRHKEKVIKCLHGMT